MKTIPAKNTGRHKTSVADAILSAKDRKKWSHRLSGPVGL